MATPIIEVEHGILRGRKCVTSNDVEFFTFKGIPYAKPPVGELRFSAPVPPRPWGGIRDATKDCNICAHYFRETETFIGKEDCLYLNVYTPKLPTTDATSLPVMVFIHGGGFIYGSGTDQQTHGPDFLVEQDVVLVSFNYRLGILGFLSLDRKEAPGNMGLKDQVLALKWVKNNISKFGGDPNNVTIFGTSAGGASVEYLLVSPMAKGLFHKAIAQGGTSLSQWAHNSKLKKLASMIPVLKGTTVSGDDQLFSYLKALPTKDLIVSSMKALAADKFRGGINFGFVPTIEKSGDWEPFLDRPVYDLLSRGEFVKVPFMSGFCTREGLLMLAMGTSIIEELAKEKNLVEHLPFQLDNTQKTEMATRLNSIYLKSENQYPEETDAFAVDFYTDVIVLGGLSTVSSLIAKNNSPVYLYEFSYDGNLNYVKKFMNINRKGACHADESTYLLKSSILPETISDMDKLVRDRMVKLWTNFAKYGDPTPKTDDLLTCKWEPRSATGPACLVVDDHLSMKRDIYPDRTKLFEELFYNKYCGSNSK